MVDTNTHPRKFVVRGPNEPKNPFDGQVWVDTSGGNVELNQYNASAPGWELVMARGPDTPAYPAVGSLWADTNAKSVKQYTSGGVWEAAVEHGITEQDDAETFQESDVTLSHSGTERFGETLANSYGAAYSTDLTTVNNVDYGAGVIIQPQTDIGELFVRMDNDVSEGLKIYIDDTNGNRITNGPTLTGGESAFIDANLTGGTDYRVYVNSLSYDVPQEGVSLSTSTTDPDGRVAVVDGYRTDNGRVADTAFVFDAVGARRASGSVTVGWPHPNNVFAWNSVTFQTSTPSGSVDTYVEANDGSGWSEVAGPISRGYDLSVASGSNVRLRFDLTDDAAASSTPVVDAAYRRWDV